MDRRSFFSKTGVQMPKPEAFSTQFGALAGLEPYVPTTAMPWTRQRAAHLLRRTGIGAPKAKVEALLKLTPQQAVKSIIDEAVARPAPAEPIWAKNAYPPAGSTSDITSKYASDNRIWLEEYRAFTTNQVMSGSLREKMVLFWSNHLVTETDVYNNAPYAYQYVSLLRTNALGDFKKMIREIGIIPTMLIYLNGNLNRKGVANENYARELLELFTMGIGNYTQTDITEIARALTGYTVDNYNLKSVYNATRFDNTNKTFFGQTGNWGYNDVVDIIFRVKTQEVAKYICTKLYKFFVYAEPDAKIVSELAAEFIKQNFMIEPVLRLLLSSAHFFESVFIGAKIKSPVEKMLGIFVEGSVVYTDANFQKFTVAYLPTLDQKVLEPPNVAGWPEHQTWINTNSLSKRWQVSDLIVTGSGTTYPALNTINLAKLMSNISDPYQLALDLANYFLAVPYADTDKQALGKQLLGTTPDYEWASALDKDKELRLKDYLKFIFRLPEFQLT